jgi:hypothetical protein
MNDKYIVPEIQFQIILRSTFQNMIPFIGIHIFSNELYLYFYHFKS